MIFSRLRKIMSGSDERNRLFGNILSLGVLQIANYVLPLLTLPYLVRVLGAEHFGLLAFSTATVSYFILFTDYGFNLSATRQISINRTNLHKINEIFSAVMIIKVGLICVSFFLLCLLVTTVDKFSQDRNLYYLSFLSVVGNALFPIWFFQGMEKMKYITILNLVAKLFFTICVFLFVNEQKDYLIVPFLTALGTITAGIWSLYIVKAKFEVTLHFQSLDVLKFQMVDGFHVFLSSIAISFYTVSTTFLLGIFANNAAVGYFAVADKILQAVKGIYRPVSQAIYPLIGHKINEDRVAGLIYIRKAALIVSSSMFIISSILFMISDKLIYNVFGVQYQESVIILRIMAFLPFLVSVSNILGVQIMLNLGFKRAFSRILVVAAVLGLALSFLLVPKFEALGSAWTIVIVEILVTVMMSIFLKMELKNEAYS